MTWLKYPPDLLLRVKPLHFEGKQNIIAMSFSFTLENEFKMCITKYHCNIISFTLENNLRCATKTFLKKQFLCYSDFLMNYSFLLSRKQNIP